MKDIENLSDISKLALSLCEDLNILYTFGKGFATLDGVPMDELDKKELCPYSLKERTQPF